MTVIDVSAAVRQPGKVFEFEYEGEPALQGIEFIQPLKLKCKYKALIGGKSIKLTGSYNTVIREECVRCLDEVSFKLDRTFEEIFADEENEDNFFTFEDNKIDLDKMLYEDIMLHVPPHILCREDCQGLCSECGANLNRQQCTCSPEAEIKETNPFAKLKDLF